MSLTLYNTLSRQKEAFTSIQPNQVSFYVCGVTVYDKCHIGHARAYVVFDTIRRYLTASGYTVNYVQNFTDIDDKIINRAHENNISVDTLTTTMIDAYFADMDALNIMRATTYPRATEHIPQMIAMIQQLINKKHAYVASDGNVWFSVKTFSNYGKLSRKVLDDLVAGKRVGLNEEKQHPADFVLWKAAKPGEPVWESPWGPGRPGWHIECSAMSIQALGNTIDIHGGGEDLIFPHHENEIAQSECCTDTPFANYWLHNGFVNVNNEKMSKSKQNFTLISTILSEFDGEVLRFYLLKSHYRTPFQFSYDGLKEAQQALGRLRQTVASVNLAIPPDHKPQFDALESRFLAAMNDDINTAEAIGVLFDLSRYINTIGAGADALVRLGQLLGLFWRNQSELVPDAIIQLLAKRDAARKNRDFNESDRIRSLIDQEGYIIEDTANGSRVKKKV